MASPEERRVATAVQSTLTETERNLMVMEEESAAESAREEEETPEAREVKEIWRLWRQSADCEVQRAKCKLCNYTGTDDEMTCHIMSTHVTPTKETTSNLT